MSNTKTSLLSSAAKFDANRITIARLCVEEYGDDRPTSLCVFFSILVDGKGVSMSHEWLDTDGKVVAYAERNNTAWPEIFGWVAEALGEDDVFAVHNAIIHRLGEALAAMDDVTPSDPEGGDDWQARVDTNAAVAEAEAEAADHKAYNEYQAALISLDGITVSGSTTADVQRVFDELMHAALNNPHGQGVIREAKEVLEGTQWQLVDGNTILPVSCPEDYTYDAPIALDILVKDNQGDGFGFEDRGPGAGRPVGGTLSDYDDDAKAAYGAIELRQLRKPHVTVDGNKVLFASDWVPEFDASEFRTGNEFRLYF